MLSPASMASTDPFDAPTVQHAAWRHTSSDVIDIPRLPSLTAVLDHMFPPDAQLSLNSPMTGSDRAPSRSPLLAPTAPSPYLSRLSSAPAEGKGSAKTTLHKDKDTRDAPSTIRGNFMATSHLPS